MGIPANPTSYSKVWAEPAIDDHCRNDSHVQCLEIKFLQLLSYTSNLHSYLFTFTLTDRF